MSSNASRREFLKRASAVAISGSAAPTALNLAAMGEASAATASDYKALVCVFLYGGNDHANTVVPYDKTSYDLYRKFRPKTGYDYNLLANTVLKPKASTLGGRQYALAPQLEPLMKIFNDGNLAVLLNIGTLTQPTSKDAYVKRSVPLPPKLMSHNDQQSCWQAGGAEGAATGWGGRMGDMFASNNSKAIFTCINTSGNAVFMSGKSVIPYRVTPNGTVQIKGLARTGLPGGAETAEALRQIVTSANYSHAFDSTYASLYQRSLSAENEFSSALSGAPLINTIFPDDSLSNQLKMVARTIASSASLGIKRQVFFVSLGGFDTHDGLDTTHPVLLDQVGKGLAAFQAATKELGVENQVTTFTGSDFGRSWGNDDGSDHGWGSMHFVMGGAVNGGHFFGSAPVVADNGPDDIGSGRLLPTMAVDQLSAALGKWMGLTEGQLLEVLPNYINFRNTTTLSKLFR